MSTNSTEYSQAYLDYDKGPLVIRVITAILIVATLFVALRIYVRLQRAREYGLALDDWLSVASVILIWAEYVNCVLTVTKGGVGLHTVVAEQKKPDALKNVFLVRGPLSRPVWTCLVFLSSNSSIPNRTCTAAS